MLDFLAGARSALAELHPLAPWFAFPFLAWLVVFAWRSLHAKSFEALPKSVQALPAVLVSAILAAASSGAEIGGALFEALLGALSGLGAIGGHHALKAMPGSYGVSRVGSAIVLGFALSMAAPACSAVLAALPVVMSVATNALALAQSINTVVQEQFRRYPNTPADVRATYVHLHDKFVRSVTALQKAAEGGAALDDGSVTEAFDDFEAAYNELRGWLVKNKMSDTQGNLLLDGQVVAALPSAAELRR